MKVRYNPFFVKLDGVDEANADGTCRRALLEDSVVGDEVLFTLVKHPESHISVSVALTFHEQIGWMPLEAARCMAPIIDRHGEEIYEGRIIGITLPNANAKRSMVAECRVEVWQTKPIQLEELIETLKTKKKRSRKKSQAKTAKSAQSAKSVEKSKASGIPARKKAKREAKL